MLLPPLSGKFRSRFHAGTDDAFETAYAQISERVDRLADALNDLPRAS